MSKHAIIKMISEYHNDVPGKMISDFGKMIINFCIEELNKPIDVHKTKKTFEAGLYIIEQIIICDNTISTCQNPQCIQDAERQKSKYMESLTKCLNEL